ncbi:unnamed protein product [Arabidopsis thaliana]|uniref:(thale cress) hypothetical protein n=1 Tax=Arabidopsis thaliana TaxID=3702 RepID=A0A654EMW1_ARATH|nr:unnamed protein product [Arabidopsis thaliana]VYS50070.1 unnamed protein product [Arabidopsis thaliana]
MVNTCRISFISFMILLLFINQSSLSSSVRIGLQGGRDLIHHRTLDEIERDKARLSFLFKTMEDAYDSNFDEDLPLPPWPYVRVKRVEVIGRSYATKGEVTESILYPRVCRFFFCKSRPLVWFL